jgi:hypothetical protein
MRTIAILLNAGLLALTVLLGLTEGIALEGIAVPFFACLILAPLVSVVALFLQGPASKDWMARILARKALEERERLQGRREGLFPQACAPPNGGPRPQVANSGGPGGPSSAS